MTPSHRALCAWAVLTLGATSLARAEQPPELKATVVAVDGEELLLDLTAEQVTVGTQLTLYRTLRVTHPVTGESIVDRFPNGRVRIVQAGQRLSIAHVVDAPAHAPAAGDSVQAANAPPPAQPVSAQKLDELQGVVEASDSCSTSGTARSASRHASVSRPCVPTRKPTPTRRTSPGRRPRSCTSSKTSTANRPRKSAAPGRKKRWASSCT